MSRKKKNQQPSEFDVPLEEWRRLYEAMNRFGAQAPWEWINEEHIFGVVNPETGETGWISITGALGEWRALSLYPGMEGWDGLMSMLHFNTKTGLIPEEVLFNVPALRASWEDRDVLTKRDRDVIKRLGLRYRGRGAWPFFRSYRPGYVPWYLTREEVRFLTHALEQAVIVAEELRETGPDILLTRLADEGKVLVRVPSTKGEHIEWRTEWRTPPEEEPLLFEVRVPEVYLEAVKEAPHTVPSVQVDLFWLPTAMKDKGERPVFPYVLLVVESENGYILHTDLLTATEGMQALYLSVPAEVFGALARAGVRPRRIYVRSPMLYNLLKDLAVMAGVTVQKKSSLRALDEARIFLTQRFTQH